MTIWAKIANATWMRRGSRFTRKPTMMSCFAL